MTIHETCAGYWQGCFVCADYLPDRVFFCRRANLARFGSGYVETEEGHGRANRSAERSAVRRADSF